MQEDFDKLMKLIENQTDEIVTELLIHCKNDEITYNSFDNNFRIHNNKSHILDLYNLRWDIEKEIRSEPFVFGYYELIPKLESTSFNDICISNICSEKGTYLVFTDGDKTQFIGVLKSKRTLSEIREKYLTHKNKVESLGEKVLYDYESNEIVFINGILRV